MHALASLVSRDMGRPVVRSRLCIDTSWWTIARLQSSSSHCTSFIALHIMVLLSRYQ
jgi:hypothetical protein